MELREGLWLRATGFRLLLCTLGQAKWGKSSVTGLCQAQPFAMSGHRLQDSEDARPQHTAGGSQWSRGPEERALNYKSRVQPAQEGQLPALLKPLLPDLALSQALLRKSGDTTLTDQASEAFKIGKELRRGAEWSTGARQETWAANP